MENTRRKFLKNTSLAALSIGLAPISGISSSLKERKAPPECNTTTLDAYGQGPFYTANAPALVDNQLASLDEEGTRLILSGQVKNLDCSQVIPNAVIDIWHANDAGVYDNNGFTLRGKTLSNAQGFYLFETILPGKYLNGNQFRPSHIHFKITPPGFSSLTTQLYFEGDTDIANDYAASITSGVYDATERIISIALNSDNKYEGIWDIIIDGNGTSSINDIHLTKGMIYSASPNPFSNSVKINYGLFEPSRVNISVFNLAGQLVATIDEKNQQQGKYEVNWAPKDSLPSGNYFISLKVNDFQVHYLKVLRK